METQTRLSRHNKFISAENIVGIFSVSSDDSFYMLCIVPEPSLSLHLIVRYTLWMWILLYLENK